MDISDFLDGFAAKTVSELTVDALNARDEAGRTPLARFVAAGDADAAEKLLADGRCDWSIADNDGKTVYDLAEGKPELEALLQKYPWPDFFYRNGEAIPRNEVYDRLAAGTLAVDEAIFDALPDDFTRALLTGKGKVAKANFEKWMELDKYSLYWEAQIALLITDEEYGRKFVDWDYIRAAAEPDEWLSFLRDLPQYAAEADWDKLNREGSPSSWRRLLEVRPELGKYRTSPLP